MPLIHRTPPLSGNTATIRLTTHNDRRRSSFNGFKLARVYYR